MLNQFNELTRRPARTITSRAALRKWGVRLAALALAVMCALPVAAANPPSNRVVVMDPAGDAVFPYDLYNAPVPPYIDVVKASISSQRDLFHFELQVNAEVPLNADPGFTPSVNHLGITFGVLTDRKTAGSPFVFFGQTDVYHFNYLVGALYSVADSGVGLGLGWHGFLIDASTFTAVEIPLQIRGDTLVLETSAASLGNPVSFDWAVGSECDPVSIPDEKTKSVLLVDYVPDHGVASWPAQ
ncbi:MAG TPA: hypothetical protein VJA21_08495 [Verrucomicrobiae bacterium]